MKIPNIRERLLSNTDIRFMQSPNLLVNSQSELLNKVSNSNTW